LQLAHNDLILPLQQILRLLNLQVHQNHKVLREVKLRLLFLHLLMLLNQKLKLHLELKLYPHKPLRMVQQLRLHLLNLL
jgi:hypothetical protein